MYTSNVIDPEKDSLAKQTSDGGYPILQRITTMQWSLQVLQLVLPVSLCLGLKQMSQLPHIGRCQSVVPPRSVRFFNLRPLSAVLLLELL